MRPSESDKVPYRISPVRSTALSAKALEDLGQGMAVEYMFENMPQISEPVA